MSMSHTEKTPASFFGLNDKEDVHETEHVLAINQYKFSKSKKDKDSAFKAEQKLKSKQKHDLMRRESGRNKAGMIAISQLKRHGIHDDTAKKVVDLIKSGKITGVKLFSD